MRKPARTGAISLALALSALGAGAVALPAQAEPASGPEVTAIPAGRAADAAHTVQLVTGDSVVVNGSGEKATVSFRPAADNPRGGAEIVRHGKDITVVPEAARSLVDAGVLDSRLFEIDDLIAQGYADGRDLPLIVQNADGSAEAPAGAVRTRALRSVPGLAARVKPGDARRMWKGLREGASPTRFADGVKHVWLDARVETQLDTSVPQIGAPEAWAAGYDGKGVKVAVLDTGIDATHPDVAAGIVEAKNFSDSADTVDRFGHGTHVASTIMGSGAASDGRYKGVAPKAELLVGKVLGDNGSGSNSQVLAGMEWAAGSGARVISMSLGATTQSNGTDPLSMAVNSLTASTGALFVIAAGNSGDAATTLGTPGVADAALTVAAVDKQDRMATFSSRGPRFGDAAIKPDISAPGVDIVAARATGTAMGAPVNAMYTSANGTSMATPHVSGAAAILAQRHPDWKAADLKGALMSSSKVLGNSAFAEGSGRVDVAKAIDASVWADNASFGRFLYGQRTGPLTRTLTFHNTADHDVTVDLDTTLKDEKGTSFPGVLSLGVNTLTIPAHGTAPVTVTATPDATTASGTYTGTVTATGEGIAAHATVAFLRELQTFALRTRLTMPDGTAGATDSTAHLYNLRSNSPPKRIPVDANGVASASVVAGRYAIIGFVQSRTGDDVMQYVVPDVTVTDKDVFQTVDGTKAKPIRVTTPRRTDPGGLVLSVSRQSAEQQIGFGAILLTGAGSGTQWAMPSAPAQDGKLEHSTAWTRNQPAYVGTALLPEGALDLRAQAYYAAARFDGTRSLKLVDARQGTDADLAATDVEGKLALVRRTEPLSAVSATIKRVAAKNPAGIMLVNPDEQPGFGGYSTSLPVFGVPRSVGTEVIAALAASDEDVVVKLRGEKVPDYSYNLVHAEAGALAAGEHYAPEADELARLDIKDYRPAADPAAAYAQEAWTGVSDITQMGSSLFVPASLAMSRTQYVTAEGARWLRELIYCGQRYAGQFTAYRPGTTTALRWLDPVLHAGTNPMSTNPASSSRPFRVKDTMGITLNTWMSADGLSGEGAGTLNDDQKSFRVYADGQLIGTSPYPAVLVKNLPAARTDYRFELDVARTKPWWLSSTKGHSEWSFSSAAPVGDAPVALGLLEADYRLEGVGLATSTIDGGHRYDLTLPFRIGTGDDVSLTAAKVEVSYDGGATWKRQPADRGRAEVRTTLDVPRHAGTVSFRISGTDVSGSSMTQTVMDAVRVG